MSEAFEEIEPCEFSLEEIVGEQVVLRPLGEADAQSLFELIDESREFLQEHLPWPEECTLVENVASRIDSWNLQAQMANGACWGIFEKVPEGADSGELREKIATVSYWLGKNFCGRGLATEALLLASSEAFALGLNRLELTASVRNPKSVAVARRAGFQEEGVCREYECLHGKFEDHLRFALLARDLLDAE